MKKPKPARPIKPILEQSTVTIPFPPPNAVVACDFGRDQYWDGVTRRFFDWSDSAPVVDAWDPTINYASVARPCGLLPGKLGTDTFSPAFRDALTNPNGFTAVIYALFNDVAPIQNILAVFNDVPGNAHRRLKLISGNLRAWQSNGALVNVDLTGSPGVSANVVHRIAVTMSPTETSLQFDGNAVQTIGGVSVPNTLNRADIGNADSAEILQGAVLGVVVYAPQAAASLASLDPLAY